MKPEALPHSDTAACKNCGATTSGNFCHQCGQTTHVHVPSAMEFLHEFVAHYVALEGKLWKSLWLLLFKPGFLTREYIEGRRARYLEPLRLYLSFSIIFFALFKLGDVQVADFGNTAPTAASALATDGKMTDTVLGPATPEQAAEFERFKETVTNMAAKVTPDLGQNVRRFLDQPAEAQGDAIKRAFFSYTPYAIFALMPVFAGFLKLLYLGSGRRYGEHFLFALHSNAFAFLMLSLLILLPAGWNFIHFLTILWLVFYLPTAMRRVYGGGRFTTALRWLVLMAVHFLSIVLAVALAIGVALLG